ncbi:MFS transporter [Actinoplanes siamensis]|uniref:MFS transporter n=1 Tax=Actinoplanes siamensis TaxID=1223317 RepID=A0A919TPW9_9ACTN|nr:MFS transporter [Actinoplanes siamensis]GIF09265.1 MFS transporter [Actinoplanes siamensis]
MRMSLWARFGLPETRGRGPLVTAVVIDSLGSGLFMPFVVLVFLNITPMSLATVGLGLSVAAVLALPTSVVFGVIVDAVGPKRVVVASNLVQAAGFMGYFWVESPWQLVVAGFVVNAGQNMFWTANGALVGLAANPGERARWFAMLRMLRNAGIGLGALAAVSMQFNGASGYRLLILGNAISFVVAALFTSLWRQPASEPAAPDTTEKPRGRGYRSVLADRAFGIAIAANALFVLCTLVLTLVLTVYVTETLNQPAWASSALFTLATVLVVVAQTTVTRHTEGHSQVRVLQLAAVLWAASFGVFWAVLGTPPALALTVLVIGVICYTAAEIVFSPAMSSLVLSLSAPSNRGRYFAVQQLSWSIPSALAPAVLTGLLSRGAAVLWAGLIAACAIIIALLAVLARTMPPGRAATPADPASRPGVDKS